MLQNSHFDIGFDWEQTIICLLKLQSNKEDSIHRSKSDRQTNIDIYQANINHQKSVESEQRFDLITSSLNSRETGYLIWT